MLVIELCGASAQSLKRFRHWEQHSSIAMANILLLMGLIVEKHGEAV